MFLQIVRDDYAQDVKAYLLCYLFSPLTYQHAKICLSVYTNNTKLLDSEDGMYEKIK